MNSSGKGFESAPGTVLGSSPGDPLLNPPAISFDANPNDGSYTASWTGETGASYELQERYGSGNWSPVYSGTAQSKAFSGKPGGTYDYRARECIDTCGDWGVASVGVTPAQATITVPTGTQGGAYTVSWSRPVGATSFDVDEQINGGSWSRIASGTSATSISRPATVNGSYVYRVEANNAYGTRGWTTSDAVTVLHPPGTAPAVTVPSISSTGSYTGSWNAIDGADSYKLQQQLNGGNWSTVYSGSATSTSLSGTTNGATYGYRAQACNAGGCGPWGSVASIDIAIPPPDPINVYANDYIQSTKLETLTIVWDAVSGASRYEVATRPVAIRSTVARIRAMEQKAVARVHSCTTVTRCARATPMPAVPDPGVSARHYANPYHEAEPDGAKQQWQRQLYLELVDHGIQYELSAPGTCRRRELEPDLFRFGNDKDNLGKNRRDVRLSGQVLQQQWLQPLERYSQRNGAPGTAGAVQHHCSVEQQRQHLDQLGQLQYGHQLRSGATDQRR